MFPTTSTIDFLSQLQNSFQDFIESLGPCSEVILGDCHAVAGAILCMLNSNGLKSVKRCATAQKSWAFARILMEEEATYNEKARMVLSRWETIEQKFIIFRHFEPTKPAGTIIFSSAKESQFGVHRAGKNEIRILKCFDKGFWQFAQQCLEEDDIRIGIISPVATKAFRLSNLYCPYFEKFDTFGRARPVLNIKASEKFEIFDSMSHLFIEFLQKTGPLLIFCPPIWQFDLFYLEDTISSTLSEEWNTKIEFNAEKIVTESIKARSRLDERLSREIFMKEKGAILMATVAGVTSEPLRSIEEPLLFNDDSLVISLKNKEPRMASPCQFSWNHFLDCLAKDAIFLRDTDYENTSQLYIPCFDIKVEWKDNFFSIWSNGSDSIEKLRPLMKYFN